LIYRLLAEMAQKKDANLPFEGKRLDSEALILLRRLLVWRRLGNFRI